MPEEHPDDNACTRYHGTESKDTGPTNPDHHLKTSRNDVLIEFRYRVEQAILGDYLLKKKNKRNSPKANNAKCTEIKLWGVPLLPSANHQGTNTVLLKFLKARKYKVHEAYVLLRKTMKWRAEFRVDGIVEESLGLETGNSWFCNGRDKEGRLLCYNVLGENCEDYFRWRVQCLEKAVRRLDFVPGGADSIVQVIDMGNAGNAPVLATKEVRLIYKRLMTLLSNHYPGIVYKNLIVNVPPWFLTFHALNLRIIEKRSKKNFIFVKPSKVADTLLRYATPENVLVQYGGLRRENDTEFSTDDKVLELYVRANFAGRLEIPMNEVDVTITWDVAVVGYEVAYKEEFIPEDDCSYNLLLHKEKKMKTSIRNTFSIREPGKIVITIFNGSFKRKKVFYRYKSRPSVPRIRSYGRTVFEVVIDLRITLRRYRIETLYNSVGLCYDIFFMSKIIYHLKVIRMST